MTDERPAPCRHAEFACEASVVRFDDLPGQVTVEVRVFCSACGHHLEFQGMPIGLSFSSPTVNPDATRVTLPARMAPDTPYFLRLSGIESKPS